MDRLVLHLLICRYLVIIVTYPYGLETQCLMTSMSVHAQNNRREGFRKKGAHRRPVSIVGDLDDAELEDSDDGVASVVGGAKPQADQIRDFFPEAILFGIETLE